MSFKRLFEGTWLLASLLVLAILPCTGECQSDENKPISIKELSEASLKQRNEIHTAWVEMQHVNGVAGVKVTRKMVEAALDKLVEVERRGDSEATQTAFYQTVAVLTGRQRPSWLEFLLIQDGQSVRNRISRNGNTLREICFRNGTSMHYMANFEQVQITSGRPEVVIYPVSYLRPTLDPAPPWKMVSSDVPNLIAFSIEDEEMSASAWLDAESKILLRQVITSAGGYHTYRIRGNLKTFPEDVVMPTFGINLQLRRGEVHTYSAFLIDKAEFNTKLPDSALSPTVPARTTIIDKRNPGRVLGGTAESAGDPVTLADEILANRIKKQSMLPVPQNNK